MASIVSTSAQSVLGGAGAIAVVESRHGEQFPIGIQVVNANEHAVDISGASARAVVQITDGQVAPEGGIHSLSDADRVLLPAAWQVLEVDFARGIFQLLVPGLWSPTNPDPDAEALPVAIAAVNLLLANRTAKELVILTLCRYGSGRDLGAQGEITHAIAGAGVNFLWNIDLEELTPAGTPVPSGESITLSNAEPEPVGTQDADPGAGDHAVREGHRHALHPDIIARLLPDGAETGQIAQKQADGSWAAVDASAVGGGGARLFDLAAFVAQADGTQVGPDVVFQSASGDYLVRLETTAQGVKAGFLLPAGRRLVGIYTTNGSDRAGDFEVDVGNDRRYIQRVAARRPGALVRLIRTAAVV